ncbi:hypothetical protein PR048_025987 [Dryococelus australis]|uniref:Uncharacterized protein n=1 Tax=Dryococelus australis TaxID=614101 RepID=A0ABQ9GK27_9NEOP|nr:hypothetical protein PR048_025987 [Dryococelus australis]
MRQRNIPEAELQQGFRKELCVVYLHCDCIVRERVIKLRFALDAIEPPVSGFAPYLSRISVHVGGTMGAVWTTLASHQGELGSIPGQVTAFSQVGIVTDDAVGRRVFSGISRFPAPSFRRRSIFTSITLIGSEELDVKRRPNIFAVVALFKIQNVRKLNPPNCGSDMSHRCRYGQHGIENGIGKWSGEIWTALNSEYGAAPRCKGGGKRETPWKTRRPAALSGTSPTRAKIRERPRRGSNPIAALVNVVLSLDPRFRDEEWGQAGLTPDAAGGQKLRGWDGTPSRMHHRKLIPRFPRGGGEVGDDTPGGGSQAHPPPSPT